MGAGHFCVGSWCLFLVHAVCSRCLYTLFVHAGASKLSAARMGAFSSAIVGAGRRSLLNLRCLTRGAKGHKKSSRVLGLVLIGLVAHAVFVSAAHRHPNRTADLRQPGAIVLSDGGNFDGSRQSNPDSQCLSCRVQRTFTATIQSSEAILELFRQDVTREICLCLPCKLTSRLSLSSRAPPLV